MAQAWSCSSTRWKAWREAWNQKECCSFIASLKAACASGVQLTAKWTSPRVATAGG
jgi:hypothetical protein